MNTRPFQCGRIVGASMSAILLSLAVACAPGSTSLRTISDPTVTPVASAPIAPPAPALPSGPAVGAPVNGAVPAPVGAPAAAAVAAQPGAAIQAPAPGSARGIAVSGTGRVNARPDQATVSAGVQTRGRTAQEAQGVNNQTMVAVIAAIKATGIPDRSIQTNGLSLYPNYGQNQVINGYDATNNVAIIVDNVDQVGAVLDAAVKAGANQSTSVRFGFKDETALRNRALAAAAADARGKADALAAALGVHVSGIESVAEAGVSTPIVYSQPRAFAAGSAAPAPAPPVEPGELSVTASVTIVFGY